MGNHLLLVFHEFQTTKFKYIVEWNGNWEERQTEMKDILKMKLEML